MTGHDASGKSVVLIDAPATNQKLPDPALCSTLMWITDETPADFTVEEDAGARIAGTPPPAGGTRFIILEVLPGNELHGQHRTDTIDYCICISGEIDMLIDDTSITLKAGDVLIQRGTNHAWLNRGKKPARLAVVLIDGKPKRAGSLSGVDQAR